MPSRYLALAAALVVAAMSSGCATVTTGLNQSMSVETRFEGATASGAACRLVNDKGTWFVTTPGSVMIRRSYGDLALNCTHEKHPSGSLMVRSSTKAMVFGNILIGGVIGAAVDVGTGSAYDYPSLITLELGVNLWLPPAKPEEAPKEEAPKKE